MSYLLRSFLLIAVLTAGVPCELSALERVFVFHNSAEVSIYDAETFQLLGRPTIGAGGMQAIGVPDPADRSKFLKYFVVTDDTVHTVSAQAPYATLRTSPLTVDVGAGAQGVQLTPDGRWLLVPADEFLFIFDADDPANPAPQLIEMGAPISGIGVLPDSSSAFVTVDGSLTLIKVGLDTAIPQRLAGPVVLPSVPLTGTAAPNAAGVFTGQLGTVTAVDPYANEVVDEFAAGDGAPIQMGFDMEAPLDEMFVATATSVSIVNIDNLTFDFFFSPPITIKKVLSPKSDLLYLLSGASRQVFSSNRDGTQLDLLRDPTTSTPFTDPAVDIAQNPAHSGLFVAFTGPDSLIRLSSDGGELEAQTPLPEAPIGIAVVGTPGLVTSSLEIFGGDGQAGTANEALPRRLAVRALDENGRGVWGETVTFRGFLANTVFRPETVTTNVYGVATTEIVIPTEEIFEVEARTENDRTARFRLNTGLQGKRGLEAISGDFQIALENMAFPRPTVIRTITGGVPVPDNELTITPQDAAVTCPATAMTGGDGIATFQCMAGTSGSAFPRVVRVDVEDEFGRDLLEPLFFTVASDPDDLPRDPIGVSGGLVGEAGGVLAQGIEMRLIRVSGFDSSRSVGVEFESTRSDMEFIPRIPVSDINGRVAVDVRFGCRLGRGTITSSVNAPGLVEDEFEFRTVPGPPVAVARVQGNGQNGDANDRLDGPGQALVARVVDRCGNPISSFPLTWEVNPPGAVTLLNPFATTNGDGLGSTIVVLGSRPGPVSITLRAGEVFTTFDLAIKVTPTQLLSTGGNNQQVSAGAIADMTLTADLLNGLGAGAEGVPIEWVVADGAATFIGGPTGVTDEQGRAAVRVRAGLVLGALVIEARAAGFSTTFNLEVVGRIPVVSSVGFVNGASFVVGIVPGSLVSIFGVGLMEGVDGVIIAGPAPFPTELRGVRVLIGGVDSPILGVANVNGQEQINIQAPFFTNAPATNTVVTVVNNGVSASFAGVRTFVAQPGVFEVLLPEGRFAAALHGDGRLVTPADPALVGETIQLFWTGGGPISPPLLTNTAGGVAPLSFTDNPPVVVLDGQIQNVVASVYAPGLLTVYQANVTISATRSGVLLMTINMLGQASPEVQLPVAQ